MKYATVIGTRRTAEGGNMSKRASVIIAAIVLTGLFGGQYLAGSQYLAHAADMSGKGSSFVITSSTATNNVTDLWVLDQQARVLYLCRSSGGAGSAPVCSKGMPLP